LRDSGSVVSPIGFATGTGIAMPNFYGKEAPNLPAFNFRITDELNLGQGSETQKFNDNIAAITSLKNINSSTCEGPG
jgi:hypothetical protein